MSIDTTQYRKFYGSQSLEVVRQDINQLCDEIDRLRECDRKRYEEHVDVRQELAKLREQLRPRSIKDEPPLKNVSVLVWMGKGSDLGWYSAFNPTEQTGTVWLPKPPAPPAPDKFEEWAKAQPWWDALGLLAQAYMRDCWEAAKKDQP